jgi:tyrosyl-tRNA synthetase
MPDAANLSKIDEVLTRGVENIYPSFKELKDVLVSGKKLKIYCGIDPTGKLHIGHGAVLGKLRQFQDLGHEIIVLIGDFTATIGDPSGKSKTRKPLSRKEVLTNAKNYKGLIKKILDLKKSNVRFLYNEKWTNKLKPIDLLSIASNFTVARLLERDMFQERIRAGNDITVQEFLYPILQAHDSVSMDVDMEIGGNDQTFNMLAGRTLMKKMKDKEKFVLTTKILTDPAGKKMGKTEGNIIALDDNPQDMYGKIMSWPDSLTILGFELCTRVALTEIEQIKTLNPRDAKAKLAFEIVKLYHSEKEAQKAEEEFNRIFRDKELPQEIEIFKTDKKNYPILDLLCDTKLAPSKNEAKRLVEGGAVSMKMGGENQTETKIIDWKQEVVLENDMVLQVGKRRFVKIKI